MTVSMGRRFLSGFILLTGLLVLLGTWGARRPLQSVNLKELPNFTMTGVTAKARTTLGKKDLLGHPWIANFIFTHCSGPCPQLTMEMTRLQSALPRDVRLVTFTVDPDRDTPEVLQQYAQWVGADPKRWVFLRGEKGALYRLMYEGFKLPMVEDRQAPSGFRVTHSLKFVLVDSRGAIRGYYNRDGVQSLTVLQRDVNTLLKEEARWNRKPLLS
ncbi:MAG: SCO family protein [Elusimicrobia bacterium]|nr:SCO family protein [Elusimicrobiota bacterium]